MLTLRYRTLVACFAGVAFTIVVAFSFQAWRADAADDPSTAFVPMPPCRLIDTRPAPDRVGTQGALGVDDTRTVQARGTNGDCTIPPEAKGLSANVTAVGATASTFLTVWPDGNRPKASSLNPFPGQPPTPNAVTTELSVSGAFEIYNLQGVVDVIVDVNGYYVRHDHDDHYGVGKVGHATGKFQSTASTSFVDVTGSTASVTTGSNGRLLITFSSETECEATSSLMDWCQVQVLVDGVLVSPGPIIYETARKLAASAADGWAAHSHQWVTDPLPAGTHTVAVQYRVDTTGATFAIDNWTHTVLPLIP